MSENYSTWRTGAVKPLDLVIACGSIQTATLTAVIDVFITDSAFKSSVLADIKQKHFGKVKISPVFILEDNLQILLKPLLTSKLKYTNNSIY